MKSIVDFIIYCFVLLYGVCIGSFLNVVIYRVPIGISVAKGRSFCPCCKEQIKNLYLIPTLGFIFSKGKCSKCKQPISFRYPIIEILTGLLFVLSVYYSNNIITAICYCFICCILICIAIIDWDTMTIPDIFLIILIIPALILTCTTSDISIWQRLIGVFIISLPMLILTNIIPDSFGGGDIKLFAVSGFLLGAKLNLLAGFIAIILGGVAGIIQLKKAKQNSKIKHIPFGPYICIGIFLSLLWGNTILNWYFNLF